MSGLLSVAAQHAREELVLDDFLSSTSVEDSGNTIKPSLQVPVYFPCQRPVLNGRATLPAVAVIVFLLLFMYICSLGKSKESGVRGRFRKLSEKEGEEREKDVGSRIEDVCGRVEEAVSFQGAAQTASPGPSPAATKNVFEEKSPRKRKRKTRWLEEQLPVAAQSTKKAREDSSSSLPGSSAAEEDTVKLIEDVVIKALENLGPEVEDWSIEFNEESLWMPSPAPTPQVPHEPSGELEGLPNAEDNLRHLFQAAEQLQGEQQQRPSPSSTKRIACLPGSHTSSLLRQLLLKPHPPQGEEEFSTGEAFFLRENPRPDSSASPMKIESHSFYRIPPAPSDVQVTSFDAAEAFAYTYRPVDLSKRLGTLRELFAKQTLRADDLHVLKTIAYSLLHHASRWSVSDFNEIVPSRAVEMAARRFLVVDGVWCICAVVGSAMNPAQWWNRLIAHAAIPESAVKNPLFKGKFDWRPLIGRFRNAIEQYRRRRRPEAAEIVGLKQAIFCDPHFHHKYRGRMWDSWRQDDEEFKRRSGIS